MRYGYKGLIGGSNEEYYQVMDTFITARKIVGIFNNPLSAQDAAIRLNEALDEQIVKHNETNIQQGGNNAEHYS